MVKPPPPVKVRLGYAIILFGAAAFCQSQTASTSQTSTIAGDIYKKASPAVVLIETYDEKGEVKAAGSGFLVSADGRILTNYHVVAHTKQATVRLASKDAYDSVDVLDIDKRKDIALIKIKAVELPFLTVGTSAAIEIGDGVFSLSTPLGLLQNTLSNGIVSGIRQGDGYRYLQITAPISHGSSGGPIFNDKGEVIGIAVMTISEGQSLNFAIPIDYAKGMLGSPSAPRNLASIYEPETQTSEQNSTTRVATSSEKMQNEINTLGIWVFLEHKFGIWTLEDFKPLLGEPHGHRYGVGEPMPDIWAFDDPTKVAREIELVFDGRTRMLSEYIVYPVNATWEDCKKTWGDEAWVKKNKNGTRYYMYKKRNLNVLLAPNGTVINVGVFARQ